MVDSQGKRGKWLKPGEQMETKAWYTEGQTWDRMRHWAENWERTPLQLDPWSSRYWLSSNCKGHWWLAWLLSSSSLEDICIPLATSINRFFSWWGTPLIVRAIFDLNKTLLPSYFNDLPSLLLPCLFSSLGRETNPQTSTNTARSKYICTMWSSLPIIVKSPFWKDILLNWTRDRMFYFTTLEALSSL